MSYAPPPIRSYRLYVTGGGGRIDKVSVEIREATDVAAIAAAKRLVGEVPFEIWDGNRRVETIGHGDRASRS